MATESVMDVLAFGVTLRCSKSGTVDEWIERGRGTGACSWFKSCPNRRRRRDSPPNVQRRIHPGLARRVRHLKWLEPTKSPRRRESDGASTAGRAKAHTARINTRGPPARWRAGPLGSGHVPRAC